MRSTLLSVVAFAALLSLVACGPAPTPPPDGGPSTPRPAGLSFRVPPVDARAGESLPAIEVALAAANGEVVTGASATISLELSAGPNDAVLLGTTLVDTVDGVARFESLSIRTAGAGYVLTASAEGLPSVAGAQFTLAPGAAATLELSGLPETLTAGDEAMITVTARDVHGNRATTFVGGLEVTSSDPAAVLPPISQLSAAQQGQVTLPLSLRSAGRQSFQAALVSTAIAASAEVTITSSSAARLRFDVQPTTTEVRNAIDPPVRVAVEDAFGNTVLGTGIELSLSLSGGAAGVTLAGTKTVAVQEGFASFDSLSLETQGTSYALEATAQGLVSATSTVFTVTDTTAPASLADLAVFNPAARSVSVRWTAPGDDGVLGRLDRYTVKYATSPITTAAEFDAATSVSAPPPANPGQLQSATITGLTPNTAYHLVVRATDDGGNSTDTSLAFSTTPAVPASLVFTSQPASRSAGATLPVIEVKVLDAQGDVVSTSNATISLFLLDAADNPAPSLGGTTTVSAASGVATFSNLSVTRAGANYKLQALSGALPRVTSAAFSINPGSASQLGITAPIEVVAGAPFSVTVTAQDGFGNAATDYVGTIRFSSLDGRAVLPADRTFTAGDQGSRIFTGVSLARAGASSLAVADTVVPALSRAAAISVEAADASKLTFSVQPTAAEVRSTLTPAVRVAVTDAFDNPVSAEGTLVTLALAGAAPGVTLSGTGTVAIEAGEAIFDTLSIAAQGNPYTLVGTANGLSPATSQSFAITDTTAPALVGDLTLFNAAPRILTVSWTAPGDDGVFGAADRYVLKYSPSPITTEAQFNSANTATTSQPALSGQREEATLTGLTPNTAYYLVLRAIDDAGNASTTSNVMFSTTPAVAASLAFSAQPASSSAGSTLQPVEVSVLDSEGQVVVTSSHSISLSLLDGAGAGGTALGGNTNVTAVAGVARFDSLSVSRSGANYTLRAQSGSLTQGASATFSIAPGPAAALFLTAPASATAGSAFNVSLSAHDAHDNVATGYAGTVSFASSDPSAALPANYTFTAQDQGSRTFSVSLHQAGSGTVEVSDPGASLQASASVQVNAAAAQDLVFKQQPTNGTVRNAVSQVIVGMADAYGNVLTGSGPEVSLSLASAPAGVTLGGTTSASIVGGSASFGNLTLDTEATGYALQASAAGFTPITSDTFEIVDDVFPAQPALSVVVSRFTAIELAWTAVGDDGLLGTATSQQLRYATTPIVTESDFAAATPVSIGAPQAPGSAEQVEVTGLSGNTPYHFALRVVDSAGNASIGLLTASTAAEDPCASITCTPPPDTCAADNRTRVTSSSSCQESNGIGTCVESTVPSPCPSICAAGACQVAIAPVPGQLFFNEVMHSPLDETTEYIELVNTTDAYVDLEGVTLTVGSQSFTFASGTGPSLFVGPRGFWVVAANADVATNGGVAANHAWGSALSVSGTDALMLTRSAETLAQLTPDLRFPQSSGRSMGVARNVSGTSAIRHPWYWCSATELLGGGNFGSPGAQNGDCGVLPSPPIDWCNVQFPKDVSVTVGSSQTFYGKVYEPLVTTQNLFGNDEYPHLMAEFGYGSDATDPTSWTWSPAAFNPGYAPASSNDDETQSTATVSELGSYSTGFRYRLFDPDQGVSSDWAFCGRDDVVAPESATAASWGTLSVTAPRVLISEISARGATVQTDEFIELYNPTDAAIDLSGWKVQYRATAGVSYTGSATIPAGSSIPARGYFLLAHGNYTGPVSPDSLYTFDMAAGTTGGGHVRVGLPALTTSPSDVNEVDRVGYGTAVGPEGQAAPFHPAAGGSLERKAVASSTSASMEGGADVARGNGQDTDDNSADFVARVARDPQNSASPTESP